MRSCAGWGAREGVRKSGRCPRGSKDVWEAADGSERSEKGLCEGQFKGPVNHFVRPRERGVLGKTLVPRVTSTEYKGNRTRAGRWGFASFRCGEMRAAGVECTSTGSRQFNDACLEPMAARNRSVPGGGSGSHGYEARFGDSEG